MSKCGALFNYEEDTKCMESSLSLGKKSIS